MSGEQVKAYLRQVVERYIFNENNVDTKIVMHEAYEEQFGIYNHTYSPVTRPMASVAYHPSEDTLTHSMLTDSLRHFHLKKIKEIWGINYLEYMSLPISVTSMMREISDEISSQKRNQADEEDRMLKNAMNGIAPNMKK